MRNGKIERISFNDPEIQTMEDVNVQRDLLADGKRAPITLLINAYNNSDLQYDVRMASLEALAESKDPLVIEAIQKSVDISKQINKTFFLSEFNDGLWFGCCHDRSYAASFLIRTAYALQNTNNNNVPGGGNESKMMIDHLAT